jgi:hypothetical protein
VLVPATLSGLWIVSITSSLSSWDSATSTTANTSREPQHASAISRETRDLPSDIARLARSHRNDDVGSHDLPSTAPFDCLRPLQSRQWCVQGTVSQRPGLCLSRSSMGNARNAGGKTSGFERLPPQPPRSSKRGSSKRLQLNLHHSSAGRCRLDLPNSLWDRDSLFRSYYTLLLGS